MNSPSDLALLRVYLPEDLVDDLHALARRHELPMRHVVRGILELGLPLFIERWRKQLAPSYVDGLSPKPWSNNHSKRDQAREAAARGVIKELEDIVRQRIGRHQENADGGGELT